MPLTTPRDAVELILTLTDGLDDIAQRNVQLVPDSDVMLGRSSKDSKKKLISSYDNCWLSSPVVSRKHARLAYQAHKGEYQVTIEDIGSSHGTFIGPNICDKHTKYAVKSGDTLRFGANVIRGEGSDDFSPPSFKVDLIYGAAATNSIPSYRFPESLMDDSDAESLAPSSSGSLSADARSAAEDSLDDEELSSSDIGSTSSRRVAGTEKTILESVIQHDRINDEVEDLCEDLYEVPDSAEPAESKPQSSSPAGVQPAFAASYTTDTTTAPFEVWFPPAPSFVNYQFAGTTVWPPATTKAASFDLANLPSPSLQFKGCYIPSKSDDLFSVEESDKSTTKWGTNIVPEDTTYLPSVSCLVEKASTLDGPRASGVKNGISIESLINRTHTSSPSKSSKGKRKYADVDDVDDVDDDEDIAESRDTKLSMADGGDHQPSLELGSSQVTKKMETTKVISRADLHESILTCTAEEPARKRQRSRLGSVAFGLSCFAAGGITAITALASLPDSFFG